MAAGTSRFTAADFERHVERLKEKLPSDDFTIVVEPPFVVIGDEPTLRVKARAKDTVKWAVDRLKALYFQRDPEFIIDIWLFRDRESYEGHAEKLFGDKPHTPYGYYSAQHRALVMTHRHRRRHVGTRNCTPIHGGELCHLPFVVQRRAGVAVRAIGKENGQIKGFVNWRLDGLQRTIRAGRLPNIETLCGTTTDEFYHRDEGANYGQARYLCLYLQEHGLLKKFYDEFRARANAIQPDTTCCSRCSKKKIWPTSKSAGRPGCFQLRRPD